MKVIDIHAHSSLQPYGQMFKKNPSKKDLKKMSLWYYNPPKFLKALGEKLGISSYSQANLFSCGRGNARALGISLYSPEISFFKNKLPSLFGNGLENIVTRYSVDRIEEIESGKYDYYEDLKGQYEFVKRFNNTTSTNSNYKAILAKDYDVVNEAMSESYSHIIAMVVNIEGGHCLGVGYPKDKKKELTENQKKQVLENALAIKSWEFPCLYITFCHHFYNQLCGHSKSLPDSISKIIDQSYGLDMPLTEFGAEVIRCLLDNQKGHRILIDIKHMSMMGREAYFNMLQDYKQKGDVIPIIYSHGGANGRDDWNTPMMNSKNHRLNPSDLSLFDNEIIAISDSKGMIGLNIDQRVMSSEKYCKKIKRDVRFKSKSKRKELWSSIVWENIKYIAELLYKNGRNPWGCMVLGTDFDGAINPINFFLEESDLPELGHYLKIHLDKYLASDNSVFIDEDKPKMESTKIIEMIMYDNAYRFFNENFRSLHSSNNSEVGNVVLYEVEN